MLISNENSFEGQIRSFMYSTSSKLSIVVRNEVHAPTQAPSPPLSLKLLHITE
jgi:hypothetical protein